MELTNVIHEIAHDRPELSDHLDSTARKRALAIALVTVRKKLGLTQTQLAERAGFKQSFVSKLESPSGPMPETETIHRYAKACGVQAVVSFWVTEESHTNSNPLAEAPI